jgi:hypothetical protein
MPFRRSNIRNDLDCAKRIITERGVISQAELYLLLEVGINKFYLILRLLKEDPQYVVRDGYVTLKQLYPQKTLEETLEAKVDEVR